MRFNSIGFGQETATTKKAAEDLRTVLLMTDTDGMTPIEAFRFFRKVQEDAKALEAAAAGAQPWQLHAIRFAASKSAANLWRSLTPAGREAAKAEAKGVIDQTPPLVNAVAKDDRGYRVGTQYDVAAHRFILPNGKIAPGARLGQEKARLGWKEADHAQRMQNLQALKTGGGYMKASEVRDALDQTKPFPADAIRAKGEKAANTKAKESARPVGPVGAPAKGKPVSGFGRLGYAWEVDLPVTEYVERLQSSFNGAPLETQIAILDKTSDISSALDAKDSLGLSEEEVLAILKEPIGATETGMTIHPAVYWVGGAVVVGLILYFVLREKS
jgi:hypothetical protein